MRKLPLLLLAVAPIVACDGGERAVDGADEEATSIDTARLVSYDEQILFLADGPDVPAVSVLDFGVRVDSIGTHRDARAWRVLDDAWVPLLAESWETAPMRDPWRLVPHGPLRLLADVDGDVETLVIRNDDPPFRLLFGGAVAEWSPGPDVQLRVRRGEAVGGGPPLSGVAIDLRRGHQSGPDTRQTSETEAYLTDGRATYFVLLARPRGRRSAWLSRGRQQESWDGATIGVDAWSTAPDELDAVIASADASVRPDSIASRWRVGVPDGIVAGELERVGQPTGMDAASGYSAVRGWLEINGQRVSIFGVVRHGIE